MPTLNTTSRSSTAVQLQNLLHRIERRIDSSRHWGREGDEIVKQFGDLAASTWPDVGLQAVDFALKGLRLLEKAAERSEGGHRHFIAASDLIAIRLLKSLESAGEDAVNLVEDLYQFWVGAKVLAPGQIAMLYSEHAHPTVVAALLQRALTDRLRFTGHFAELRRASAVPGPGPLAGPHRGRDYCLLLVFLNLRLENYDEALRLVEAESTTDPKMLELAGDVLFRAGRLTEAVDRMRRSAVLNLEPSGVREKLLLIGLAERSADLMIEQILWLTERHDDLMYWHLINDELGGHADDLLLAIREGLRDRSIAVFADILVSDGDLDGVLEISGGKNFAATQLWRMADFLARHDQLTASRLYERAITLEGATVQSRNQCSEFADRVRRVLPFFEQLGRASKPRRLAREVLARQKNNTGLKRELERVFETAL